MVVLNALHMKTMDNNLPSTFVTREAIIEVENRQKNHVYNPSIEDNAIHMQEAGPRITLQLWGVFSFFHTCTPIHNEIEICDKSIFHTRYCSLGSTCHSFSIK